MTITITYYYYFLFCARNNFRFVGKKKMMNKGEV